MGITAETRTSYLKPKPADKGSGFAGFLLFLLILAVCVGPRLRVAGEGPDRIDVRYQDILLIPSMVYLLLSNAGKLRMQLVRLIGHKLSIFIYGAVMVTLLVTFFYPDVSPMRRAFFLGRGLELFMVASVAAGLFIKAKPVKASRAALWAVYVAAYGNAAWMAYQMALGTTGTILGSEVSATIESYGPKLIGEGSAFGTGQFFAFTAAVAAAQLKMRYGNQFFAFILLFISAGGAWVSQSRISIGIVLLCVIVLLVLSPIKGRLLNIGRTGLSLMLLWAAFEFVLPQLEGRQSVEGIEAGVGVRVEKAWDPLLGVLANNPLLGAGPGGLVGELPVEAHNIYLRALVDYGLIIGPLFILIFVSVMFKAFKASRDESLSLNTRFFANLAFLAALGILVCGFVQDALTGVMSSHLTMLAIGLFAGARLCSQEEPAPPAPRPSPYRRTKWLPANDRRRFATTPHNRTLPANSRR